MAIELSCALVPSRSTVDQVQAAERLGYRRAWFYDSPSMYQDLWVTLGRAAERTESIGLAAGVASAGLRHVMVTSSALLSLESAAPGRITFGVGVGGTSMLMLGRPPVRWADTSAYIETIRGLLRGETMVWDGKPIRFTLPDGSPRLPVEIPIIVAAEGPRGEVVAAQRGDGIFTIYHQPQREFPRHSRLVVGTVLEPGEDATSDRAFEAAGPGAALPYRVSYVFGRRDALAALPGGTQFMAAVDALGDEERQSVLWRGQSVHATDFDRSYIPREAVPAMTLTGSAEAVARRLTELNRHGISEVVYSPAGPDIERELAAFAHAAALAAQAVPSV